MDIVQGLKMLKAVLPKGAASKRAKLEIEFQPMAGIFAGHF